MHYARYAERAPEALHLFLIRHGPTAWNEARRYQGWGDPPLSKRGVARAEGLAGRASDLEVERIVASDLLRARQTAEIAFPGHRIDTDQRLRELHFGDLEGKTYDQCLHAFGDPFRAWIADPERHDPPGGERLADFQDRVRAAVCELSGPGRIALVAHSGTIRTLLADALRVDYRTATRFRISGGSVTKLVRYGEAEWVVEAVNLAAGGQ